MRTRAKICGITRVQDIKAVVDAGADAIGFVFFPPSPRSVNKAEAIALVQAVPTYVCKWWVCSLMRQQMKLPKF